MELLFFLSLICVADFLLLVSPVVPPCCYGQVLAVCERRGFSLRGLQRLQVHSHGASLLGLSSFQVEEPRHSLSTQSLRERSSNQSNLSKKGFESDCLRSQELFLLSVSKVHTEFGKRAFKCSSFLLESNEFKAIQVSNVLLE